MTESESGGGFADMGKWLAIASELPCMVISLLFVGQIIGSSWGGTSGAVWGAIIGAIAGFFIGVVSIFKTISYYERLETTTNRRPTYAPPMEEILEDVEFAIEGKDDSL